MDRFAAKAISDIVLGYMLEDIGQQLSVGVDDCKMNGTTKIGCTALLKHCTLFELNLRFFLIQALQMIFRVAVDCVILLQFENFLD